MTSTTITMGDRDAALGCRLGPGLTYPHSKWSEGFIELTCAGLEGQGRPDFDLPVVWQFRHSTGNLDLYSRSSLISLLCRSERIPYS